jgi:hypothetical protein
MNKNSENYQLNSVKYAFASFMATYLSGVVHPLEIVKTRFQSNFIIYLGHDGKCSSENIVPKYSGIKNALTVIYETEGFRGLYKGFYVSLFSQASTMSFFFWQYIIN